MKTLTQYIKESLKKKSTKEVSNEKPVEEDMSGIMRTNPAKESMLTRGTNRIKEERKENSTIMPACQL